MSQDTRFSDDADVPLLAGDADPPSAQALFVHTTTVETRHGRMTYPVHDDPIGRSLGEYGEWAHAELELLESFAIPGSTVVDVGANLGTHTLAFAKYVGPDGCVIGIEPQPPVFALLAHNVRANGAAHVRLVNACAGAEAGSAAISEIDLSVHQNLGAFTPKFGTALGGLSVPVVALDSLRLTAVSLLKIDVEGAEALVLRGAVRTIEEQRPIVYFEANSLNDAVAAVRWVEERGYRTFLHRAAAFHASNFRGNTVNTFGFATETNVLAIPAERDDALAIVAGRSDVFPFETLDELAKLLLESPRYGDATLFDRSPDRLREALRVALEDSAAKQRVATSLERRIAELSREASKLEGDLHRARESANVAASKAARIEVTSGALRSELERLRSERMQAPFRLAEALVTAERSVSRARDEGLARTRDRIAKSFARNRRHARERVIVLASELFDVEFYVEQGGDSRDPVGHYLARGAREGLDPHPLFDTSYYREHYPDVAQSVLNPLVHYLTHGAKDGRNPNRYFDGNHYLAQVPELRESGISPLIHYLRFGADAGLRPSELFDPAFYVATNTDLGPNDNPLVHFLRWGEAEGRVPNARGARPGVRYEKADPPTLPTEQDWEQVAPHSAAAATVDVIVPVYRGMVDTLRCIERVLAARNEEAFELVVIDDASPEPELSRRLAELAGRGLFTYLRNETNRGFVGTVNRGMSLHPDRDVVLLNSDTEVHGNWLDRMRRVVREHLGVGTVTPFSNSATICSYPFFPEDNAMRLEVSYAALDELAAETNRGRIVELPTGVGFCMYIARACLDEVGLFDEERFGKGYGEENDFCRRALKRGWKSAMALDVFVRHTGGASFQGEKAPRVARAMELLRESYPDYHDDVASFISEDPLRRARERLDLARVRRSLGSRAVAIVTHTLGGGTEQHVQDLVAMAKREGIGVLLLRPAAKDSDELTLETGIEAPLPNLPTLRLTDVATALDFFEAVGVQHVHVHHLVGFASIAPRWVEALARSGRVTVDYTIHDYSPVCPRINLIGATGAYCGEPEVAECERCVSKLGSPYGKIAVGPFRQSYRTMLGSARRIFVPNEDVRDRMVRYFPELEIAVVPHPEPTVGRHVAAKLESGQRLRVAVLGAIGPHKGYDVLLRCAEDARSRSLPIDFVVVGYTCDDVRARRAGIEITGAYETNAEAHDVLERIGAHVAFFPAVWPETYSYTLSLALHAGLHPVAFAFGAIAERARVLSTGTLLPLETMTNAAAINDALVALAGTTLPVPPACEPRTYVLADYYDDRV